MIDPLQEPNTDDTEESAPSAQAHEELHEKTAPIVIKDYNRVHIDYGPTGHDIILDFDHMRSTTSGDIDAEVSVIIKHPALMPLLRKKRLKINNDDVVTRWANSLADSTGEYGFDRRFWRDLLENATVEAVERFREGTPPVLLKSATRPEGGVWLIDRMVLMSNPTIWFGDGSSGKSLMALVAAVSIQTGKPLLGTAPTEQKNVLYLDYEFDQWSHCNRMKAISDQLGIEPPDILYMRCTIPLYNDVDRITKVIRDHEIGFIVLDSVGPACGGEPESADIALRFFEALRKLGVGALCIAHETKQSDHMKPFGSAMWYNMSRLIYYVKKDEDSEQGYLRVAFMNRKANVASTFKPFGFGVDIAVDPQGDMALVRIDPNVNVEEMQGIKGVESVRDKVYKLMQKNKGRPMTINDISVELGMPGIEAMGAIRNALEALRSGAWVVELPPEKHGDASLWALKQQGGYGSYQQRALGAGGAQGASPDTNVRQFRPAQNSGDSQNSLGYDF